jgi:hypothetical protein
VPPVLSSPFRPKLTHDSAKPVAGNTQLLRTRQPQKEIAMSKARNKKSAIDPIFAAIDAHRNVTAIRYPILEAMGTTRDGAPERRALEDAHDKFANIEKAATVKLRKIQPTTIAGVMAVTAYFVEHIDRYPDCGWITDPKNWDDPCWFEHSMIRNWAAALAKIGNAGTLVEFQKQVTPPQS